MKRCVLDDTKECVDCGECERCDIDPNKICDNCCKCLETDQLFAKVGVADIVTEQTHSYLREYYADDAEYEDDAEYDIPFEQPDAQLASEWEQKLKALEEQEKQHVRRMYGSRKRPGPAR